MDERIPSRAISSSQIALLVRALESLTDGELAVDMLIAAGEGSILPLEEFLLRGKARTIAVPRCRAARALGGLRARETLLSYFAKVDLPADPVVLFAEDAVRSTVAHELLHWRDDEVFYALLRRQRNGRRLGSSNHWVNSAVLKRSPCCSKRWKMISAGTPRLRLFVRLPRSRGTTRSSPFEAERAQVSQALPPRDGEAPQRNYFVSWGFHTEIGWMWLDCSKTRIPQ